MSDDLKRKIESILFAAGRAVSLKELQSLIHINEPGLVKETIRELRQEYDDKQSSMMILSEGDDAWKLTVREGFLPLVRKINPHTELSKTILETLAVIAWKQPALQSDVIKIRTNKAYDHIAELVRLGFVLKERHGRSYLVKVTQKFLDYFDLPDDKSIKDVFRDFKDIEVAVQKKGKQLSEEQEKGKMDKEKKEKSAEDKDEVAEEGPEIETYVDALPPMDMPKRKNELDTYIDDPEGEEDKQAEEQPEKEEEKPGPVEGDEEKEEKHEETPAEKARRIAHELVEEDEQKEKKKEDEEVKGKKLHPELEEFIAGAEKEHKEKAAPEKPEEEAEPEEKPEEEEPAEGQTESGPGPAGPAGAEEADKPKPAEEYPGQFDEGQEQGKDEEEK